MRSQNQYKQAIKLVGGHTSKESWSRGVILYVSEGPCGNADREVRCEAVGYKIMIQCDVRRDETKPDKLRYKFGRIKDEGKFEYEK